MEAFRKDITASMNQPLIVRYTSNWPSRFDPAGELFYEGPRRQRQLIALAQQQLEAQKVAAHEIASSNLASAEMIANSINQQSDALTSAIGEAASDIAFAVACLGNRICASLDEIKWQLAQMGKTLDGILATLLDSRNNEAQQLVRQGVRHYVNSEHTEAEERFRLALNFDSTDYQVLLNLAFIEIHKNDGVQAHAYFRKALTLPDSLDDTSKARALWAWARLYYAERDFGKALEIAKQAIAIESVPMASSLFTVGVYAGIAGNVSLCLANIRSAIQADCTFFAKAAVEPDLVGLRPRVLQLLSEMSAQAEAEACGELAGFFEELGNVKSKRFDSSYRDLLEIVRQYLDQAGDMLTASFKDCLTVNRLTKALRVSMAEIIRLYEQMACAQEYAHGAESQHKDVMQAHGTPIKETPVRNFGCLLHAAMYAFTGLCGMLGAVLVAAPNPTPSISIWIFDSMVWPLAALIVLIPSPENNASRGGFYVGFLAGLIIWRAVFHVLVILPKKALERAQRENANKREQIAKSTTELDEAHSKLTAASEQIENQRKEIDQQLSQMFQRDE